MITLLFAVLAAILYLVFDFLRVRPDLTTPIFLRYLLVGMFASLSVVIVRILSYLVIDVIFTRLSRKVPSELLRLVVGFFLYGISSAIIMRYVLGADIAAIVTTSALITAIFGFALQATLGNLFEGLSLQVHQPFHIGDRIEVGDFYGVVESLTWRAVTVRQEDQTIISIPNNMLAQGPIRVFPADQPVRLTVRFPAPIDVPPRRVINVVMEAIVTSPEISPVRSPEVIVDEIASGESALIYHARFYALPSREIDRVRGHIRERIWYALARNGVPMPASIEGDVNAFKIPLLRSRSETILTEKDELHLIAGVSLFEGMSTIAISNLTLLGVRLIFAPGEAIELEGQSRYSMFVVLRGLVNIPLPEDEEEIEEVTSNTEVYWQPEVLEQIRQQYAEFMGPMSGYLVREASRHTSDPFHLYRMLADDIPNEIEKQAFIALGPKSPAKEIEAGKFFGERALFLGELDTYATPRAVSEAEILEIGLIAFRHVLNEDPKLIDLLSRNMAHHLSQNNTDLGYLMTWIEQKMRRFHGL